MLCEAFLSAVASLAPRAGVAPAPPLLSGPLLPGGGSGVRVPQQGFIPADEPYTTCSGHGVMTKSRA